MTALQDLPIPCANVSHEFFISSERTHFFVPLGDDLPGDRRTCGSTTICAPVRYIAVHASAIRHVQRSSRFTKGNTPSMRLNHGLYEAMESSATPIESAKPGRDGK